MSKSPEQRLEAKRAAWLHRTMVILGLDQDAALRLLNIERCQSLRINPLKSNDSTMQELKKLDWQGKQLAWAKDAYAIERGLAEIRDSLLIAEGKVYIQNAASWLPVIALDPQPGDDILDVCAAPGGKTSHIAALANNQAHITANDNSRPRLAKMRANLERLGVQNVEYTLYDASQLARKLDGRQFDKILLDAPCSGEGLMRYDRDKDFATWSVAHIKRLQQLQKRILVQSWKLLKPGGTLVYSTCTMAPEEDEAVVDYLIRTQDDAQIVPLPSSLPQGVPTIGSWNGRAYSPETQKCLRFAPSKDIEAFFVCKFTKIPQDVI
ncbi:MAG TPA: RsmB/NOP family class I SAM-dependent RNA methyltransferase [Patescibacteria group bacterium]|nr:RsmB/NOP family class I SAM-dependent RNA methyltransferase [Patescibacteria group bacterium]